MPLPVLPSTPSSGEAPTDAAARSPRLSRELVAPEPLPPLSHFGATLYRHTTHAALRYALYQLGLPLPVKAPLSFIRLRPYLAAGPLATLLAPAAGGERVAAALIDPGGGDPGGGDALPLPGRLRWAVRFHRLRLRFSPALPRLAKPGWARSDGGADALRQRLWEELRDEVGALARPLGEALLADLLAALERRRARAAGQQRPPVLSRPAAALLDGGGDLDLFGDLDPSGDLDLFGAPDPLTPSWAGSAERAAQAVAAARRAGIGQLPAHRLRGRYRHLFRRAMDRIGERHRRLAEAAAEAGLLGEPEDAFFLPFDLAHDLAKEGPLPWLAATLEKNRREWEAAVGLPEPRTRLSAALEEFDRPTGESPEAAWAPLSPLP